MKFVEYRQRIDELNKCVSKENKEIFIKNIIEDKTFFISFTNTGVGSIGCVTNFSILF